MSSINGHLIEMDSAAAVAKVSNRQKITADEKRAYAGHVQRASWLSLKHNIRAAFKGAARKTVRDFINHPKTYRAELITERRLQKIQQFMFPAVMAAGSAAGLMTSLRSWEYLLDHVNHLSVTGQKLGVDTTIIGSALMSIGGFYVAYALGRGLRDSWNVAAIPDHEEAEWLLKMMQVQVACERHDLAVKREALAAMQEALMDFSPRDPS